jgi:hypothetical protein
VVNVEGFFAVGNAAWAPCAFVRIYGAILRTYARDFDSKLQHLDRLLLQGTTESSQAIQMYLLSQQMTNLSPV